jgi:hypothetical protein
MQALRAEPPFPACSQMSPFKPFAKAAVALSSALSFNVNIRFKA